MTDIVDSSLASAMDTLAGPGITTGHRLISPGDEHALMPMEAAAFAANILPIIETVWASGVRDLRGIATALNNRGVPAARGGRWHVSNVKNLVDRLQAM